MPTTLPYFPSPGTIDTLLKRIREAATPDRVTNDFVTTVLQIKGIGAVRLPDGTIAEAEIHWFEAHGIGKRRMKIKRLVG